MLFTFKRLKKNSSSSYQEGIYFNEKGLHNIGCSTEGSTSPKCLRSQGRVDDVESNTKSKGQLVFTKDPPKVFGLYADPKSSPLGSYCSKHHGLQGIKN